MALHGGLEFGTRRLARSISHLIPVSLYTVVQPADLAWHRPSTSDDRTASPNLHRFLEHVRLVVSIHGYHRPELPDKILLGGTNRSLARALDAALTVEGIPAVSNLAAIPKGTQVGMPGIRSIFRSRQVFKSNFPARCADPYGWPASRVR
jgi:phage replication-related protein YjqB (UPF0714/DUF867 family)